MVLLTGLGLTGTEEVTGARAWGEYVWVGKAPDRGAYRAATPMVIFMNRSGGTYTRGWDDSRSNVSSIVNSTTKFPAFSYGDTKWNAVMACVREIYAPFNVEVTDADPGSAPHVECVTSGSPTLLGQDPRVGGVAPFNCEIIDNAVVYAFAEVSDGDVQQICETAAQETAHAFGLDHEVNCRDPMTYLGWCSDGSTPDKAFQDTYSKCGEYQARDCTCGGTTQNSYQKLMEVLGPVNGERPTVSITAPRNQSAVDPGFVIKANAADDIGVNRVEFYVNGNYIGQDTSAPFEVTTSTSLADGELKLEARAIDTDKLSARASATVLLEHPGCNQNGCPEGQHCVDNVCMDDAPVTPDAMPGAKKSLGEECANNEDCQSDICGKRGTEGRCTEPCDPANSMCPDNYECAAAASAATGFCWPANITTPAHVDGACDCSVGGGRAVGVRSASSWYAAFVLLAVLGTLVFWPRSRRQE
jgi:hypothetical protein